MNSDSLSRRADRARQLVADPLFEEAFKELEASYMDSLLRCRHTDDLGRFRLSEAIRTVRHVRRHLESVMEAGDLAARELAELERGRRVFF